MRKQLTNVSDSICLTTWCVVQQSVTAVHFVKGSMRKAHSQLVMRRLNSQHGTQWCSDSTHQASHRPAKRVKSQTTDCHTYLTMVRCAACCTVSMTASNCLFPLPWACLLLWIATSAKLARILVYQQKQLGPWQGLFIRRSGSDTTVYTCILRTCTWACHLADIAHPVILDWLIRLIKLRW